MAKRLFLLIISSIIGVIASPSLLASKDDVAVVRVDDSKAVETVILPEPEPVKPQVVTPRVVASKAVVSQPAPRAAAPAAGVAPVNYTVTYFVSSKSEYNALAQKLSYRDIYKFRKMVYGHNASNLLLSLKDRNLNEVISITESGVRTEYKILWKRELLQVSGTELKDNRTGIVYSMSDISSALNNYDLALLTCSGGANTPYRWVLFADKL